MVIVSSDSTNTLVSLGRSSGGLKRVGSLELLQQAVNSSASFNNNNKYSVEPVEFSRTHLYLPEEEDFDDYECDDDGYWDDSSSFHSCKVQSAAAPTLPQEALYLPKQEQKQEQSLSVDTCFSYLPSLVESADALYAQEPVHYNEQTQQQQTQARRLLYVGQGEVGHAVPLQCDTLVSDRATTCHIVMIHSKSNRSVPFSTCTHLDGVEYTSSIASIFQKHQQHHQQQVNDNNDLIDLDIHIMGGYQDDHGTSVEISNWLVYLLADLAGQYQHSIKCTLQTAAVSCINTTTTDCENGHSPLGRGLAMSTLTGKVWLVAHVDQQVAGPDYICRQLRLWCNNNNSSSDDDDNEVVEQKQLTCVHDPQDHKSMFVRQAMNVPAFAPELETLLRLTDAMLLQYTSTSPSCELPDFCSIVRQTILFW
eukprot:CAMPEP_0198139078 /NCGR_PEP_ID=MMETSP1443-20131203/2412_1 /TAXON_ID=186043 /ORGANISM="Entomoneis sp., Strain CCMP2396" /LENGTH=421 /DNA_ID=CAMNT_0043801081 /DNA_START=63 /DNA_END=1325 /DNA_ORIENTATION=+